MAGAMKLTRMTANSQRPEEDLPRKMEYLEFVCHAPSEYFKSRSSPFPTVPTRPEKGYIWTHVGPTPAISIKETVTNNL
ncbi:GATA zinc finger domain-containing protein 1 [Chelonia mydas]|uniref:GATA zinc finger domain-containing protein 1 n=1 Tax=Chelonia mydas TaxID=8469 RepID=M7BI24_CHEMY|nr:GATA zinc finger domain-containing protein 1 [Chelonia mydas]